MNYAHLLKMALLTYIPVSLGLCAVQAQEMKVYMAEEAVVTNAEQMQVSQTSTKPKLFRAQQTVVADPHQEIYADIFTYTPSFETELQREVNLIHYHEKNRGNQETSTQANKPSRDIMAFSHPSQSQFGPTQLALKGMNVPTQNLKKLDLAQHSKSLGAYTGIHPDENPALQNKRLAQAPVSVYFLWLSSTVTNLPPPSEV